jgi:RNA polymerase sigma-70 factor (ECF subfamily)
MKSIAWEWKRNEGSTLDDIDVSDEGAEARGAIARLDVKRVLALFNDDPIARKMVTEMMMGTKAKDLREACGLTQTAYESKRKKIRRRLEKIELS